MSFCLTNLSKVVLAFQIVIVTKGNKYTRLVWEIWWYNGA